VPSAAGLAELFNAIEDVSFTMEIMTGAAVELA
jgi:hypothetical protein